MLKIALFKMKSFRYISFFALVIGAGIAFGLDFDNDGMSDVYENFFGLDPADSSDAARHDDADELNNLAEFERWTDPYSPDTDFDGWPDHADSNAISRAVFLWGDPDFTDGNAYVYTGPQWMLGAEKAGGSWAFDAWVVSSNDVPASLTISVDRRELSENCVMDLWMECSSDSIAKIQLISADDSVVTTDFVSELTFGSSTQECKRVLLPFADHVTASTVSITVLQADGGFKLYSTSLYVDNDGDGLDALQEAQLGTLDTNEDTDGDGLNDYSEVMVEGTMPLNSDSDYDGLTDYQEKVETLSDPLRVDTDEDGLSDSEEIALGTSPVNRDSDGDNLSDGEEVTHRYQLFRTPMLWPVADAFAAHCGGHLAVITSEAEHGEIAATVPDLQKICPWLGATDEIEDGVWRWVTDEEFDYSRWAEGEPNNYRKPQMYLGFSRISQGLVWDDLDLGQKRGALVEYSDGLDPLNPDTDGDGLPDGDELHHYGTSARSVDSDGDGISDADEAVSSTSTINADSDWDGINDNEEIAMGLDPAKSDTDGDGLDDGAELSLYQLFKVSMRWPDAKVFAEHCGGHLAVITSEKEFNKIVSSVPGLETVSPWLGATDEVEDGVWRWVTGEEFDYNCWGEGEPNNHRMQQKYLCFYLYSKALTWDDVAAHIRTGLLVEYAEGLDPFNPDTDGDGLPDGDEVHLYGSSARSTDSDGDGISDGNEVAAGMNPISLDSDRDGIPDAEEADLGLNPASADSDADGLKDKDEITVTLTDPLNADSNTNGIPDLVAAQTVKGADYLTFFESHITSTWTNDGSSASVASVRHGSPWVAYEITVTNEGIHNLTIQADVDYTSSMELDRLYVKLFIDGCDVGFVNCSLINGALQYAVFTPWLSSGTHVVKVLLSKKMGDRTRPFTIRSLQLGSIDGEDANGNGLQDWMEHILSKGLDTDGDGISDYDEIKIYGTNLLNADSDHDGLIDSDELSAGTDPLDADSDKDGVLDGTEVHETLTDPLMPEFDETATVVASLTGSQISKTTGEWEIRGTELISKSCRGFVEYSIVFPEKDLYCLNISAAHLWTKSSCTPVIPIDTSAFLVYVDDIYVGKYPLVSADESYVDVRAFLPVMPAGEHTVRLFWENVHKRLAVKINNLQLQSLGGPDADGNGTKDWVEASIGAMAGVDSTVESFVSPVCIEGAARYVPFMSIADDASGFVVSHQSAGQRWYANLPLKRKGITAATALFQNGALEVPINVKWKALNLMKHDGETIRIRKGDRVKFAAVPERAKGGRFKLEFLLDDEGETVRSPNTRPLIYRFSEAGEYSVSGTYRKGKKSVMASITVIVVDGSFPEESPACFVGRRRDWRFEGMPGNVVFEVDESVGLSVLGYSPTTCSNHLTTVSLKANDTNGDHIVLARLYPDGPVLAATKLDAFWVQNATDGYFWTVERYEDSELWEVNSIMKNLPDSVDLQIKVIIAGVLLDDYTLERWITNSDYGETGEYNFRLFHPNDSEGSVCHTLKAYQDGEFIGEVSAGEQE